MRVEMELRNLPAARILEYLQEAGGTSDGENRIAGSGWKAHLLPLPPVRITVLTVPRDLLVIEGETPAVELIHAFMRRKTMRGGG